ncbi:MAG: hypothetical protein AB8B80_00660 [Marinicellaceae bacterium]
MKIKITNERIFQITISIVIAASMVYVFYNNYGLAKDIVTQASLNLNEGAERLALYFKILITLSVISISSVILSNFVKNVSLVVSIFPIVGIIGCAYLISGSIATFGFPLFYFIPIIYIGILIFYDLYLKRLNGYKVSFQKSLNKFINIQSLVFIIVFIYIVSESNSVYQSIILFGEPDTLFYHFVILMFSNYLMLGFSCLVFIINKKIGTLLSIFPICLHQIYYYLMNYHFSKWIDIEWEFYLSFLFVTIYFLYLFQNYRK